MLETAVTRRAFLKGSGTVLTGTLALTSGAITLLAPSRTWALELQSLSAREGELLLRFTRHVFPHATLDDAVYALVVKDLDAAAAAPAVRQVISTGIERLDARAGGDWLALDRAAQNVHVHAVAGDPFFEKVRSTAVVSLYDNELAWAHFGYEGPSFSKGGYLGRGFNDLTWLPDPPAEASPPIA
jgi:hypothetical protein